MRLAILLIALIFVALGILIGALNADLVQYDFGIFRVGLPKGAALLAVLLIGWLLGGLTAWCGTRWSHRRERRRREADRKVADPA